jgi:hypothetical protein
LRIVGLHVGTELAHKVGRGLARPRRDRERLVDAQESLLPAEGGEPGLRLDLAGEPKLRAMPDAVAAKIGTGAVDNVYMTPSTEVAVMERRNERCLVLGVAALDGLRVRPLKSIAECSSTCTSARR